MIQNRIFNGFICIFLATDGLGVDIAPQVSFPVTLTMKPKVELSLNNLKLSDLVSCYGQTELCDQVYGIYLARGLIPGKRLTISRKKIAEVLSREWPGKKVEFSGAQTSHIYVTFQKIDKQMVVLAIEDYLKGINSEDRRYKLLHVSIPTNTRLFSSEYKIEIKSMEIESKAFGRSRFSLLINYYEDNLEPKHIEGQVKLAAEERIWVAKKRLHAGKQITAGDVKLGWGKSGAYLPGAMSVRGRRLKHHLELNAPIGIHAISSISKIARGTKMTVALEKGAINVKMEAVLLESGAVGETVNARLVQNNKKVSVRIANREKLVLIQ